MKSMLTLLLFCAPALSACSQATPGIGNKPNPADKKVGGNCEGCEAIYQSPVAFDALNETDTLPDFNTAGPKLLVSGTIYQRDGKTPAPGVILYIYHTDQSGIYPMNDNQNNRHGYLRGWIKTDVKGRYAFYTLVPTSYPNSTNPKHIHPIIKEKGRSAYWIDEFLFDDDPLLPASERNRSHAAGGSGLLKPVLKNGMLHAERNIILGLNVAGY